MTSPMDELRQASADLQQMENLTPPPELVQQWMAKFYGTAVAPGEAVIDIATRAAQWGADQELEACCQWISDDAEALRIVRRPKPPSLAEEATYQLDEAVMRGDCITTTEAMPALRRALKRLQQLEDQQ